ncbi:hypothetical protein BT63DRAFT_195187 [Microthyrium microscopicum]|uniref:F-box domain-containing protein n=1 Tax=Microthyrium microscopicum TaxID=703497 RepID=A0A6A6UJJ3_9PEZI|nr:hypothetical protein BT63DRAFT_195187 [Microthyrium microscopicum]
MSQEAPPPKRRITGYHSEAPYSFNDSQVDDIVRVCSYHRRDHDYSVIWFHPSTHTPVGNLCDCKPRESNFTLGTIEKLPVELIQQIVLGLDIESLFRFRQTCSRARELIDNLHEYRAITSHALNTFLALLRTESASQVSLLRFYQLLCFNECAFCPSFGNFVHLLRWCRCCYDCLILSGYVTALPSNLQNIPIRSLPYLETLPGLYSTNLLEENPYTERTLLATPENIATAYQQQNAEEDVIGGRLEWPKEKRVWRFMACCAILSFDPKTNKVESGISCSGCELAFDEGHFSDDKDQDEEELAQEVVGYCNKVYSTTSYLEHFAWCHHAQALWIASSSESVRPANLPQMCQDGGFLRARDQDFWVSAVPYKF